MPLNRRPSWAEQVWMALPALLGIIMIIALLIRWA